MLFYVRRNWILKFLIKGVVREKRMIIEKHSHSATIFSVTVKESPRQFKSTPAVPGCFLWQTPWLKTSIFQVWEQSETLSSEFSLCQTRGQLFKIGANSVGPWLEGPTKGISFFPSRAEKASQVRWDSHLQVYNLDFDFDFAPPACQMWELYVHSSLHSLWARGIHQEEV